MFQAIVTRRYVDGHPIETKSWVLTETPNYIRIRLSGNNGL